MQGSLIALITKGVGGISGFIAAGMVARLLGDQQSGDYFLMFAWVNMLAVLGRFGLDKTVLRYVSAGRAQEMESSVRGMIALSMLLCMAGAGLAGISLFMASDYLAVTIFGRPELRALIQKMAISIPLIALACLMAEALQGLSRYGRSVFLLNISTNIWFIIFLLIGNIFFEKIDGNDASLYFVVACLVTAIIGFIFLRKELFVTPRQIPQINLVAESSLPLYATEIMSMMVLWGGQLIAGIWIASNEMAYFAAAQRTAALTSLLLLALNVVTAPKFSALYATKKFTELKEIAQFTSAAVTIAAVPVVAIMCIFPETLMGVFGEDFRAGSKLLPVLAIGQLFNAVSGSVAYLLAMSGHEKDLRNATIFTGIIAIILPFLLVREYGVMGAAVSSSISLIILNLVSMCFVRKRLGFWTISAVGLQKIMMHVRNLKIT